MLNAAVVRVLLYALTPLPPPPSQAHCQAGRADGHLWRWAPAETLAASPPAAAPCACHSPTHLESNTSTTSTTTNTLPPSQNTHTHTKTSQVGRRNTDQIAYIHTPNLFFYSYVCPLKTLLSLGLPFSHYPTLSCLCSPTLSLSLSHLSVFLVSHSLSSTHRWLHPGTRPPAGPDSPQTEKTQTLCSPPAGVPGERVCEEHRYLILCLCHTL